MNSCGLRSAGQINLRNKNPLKSKQKIKCHHVFMLTQQFLFYRQYHLAIYCQHHVVDNGRCSAMAYHMIKIMIEQVTHHNPYKGHWLAELNIESTVKFMKYFKRSIHFSKLSLLSIRVAGSNCGRIRWSRAQWCAVNYHTSQDSLHSCTSVITPWSTCWR